MNIYLVGYRCTGKTSVGKRLAERMGRLFKDADLELVENCGKSIAEIVDAEGWEGFRKREVETTRSLAGLSEVVIATGGGVVLNPENIECMRKSGVIVWMTADPHTIIERMSRDVTTGEFRPSLTGGTVQKEVEETLAERLPLYEAAMDFMVPTDGKDLEEITRLVEEKLLRLEEAVLDRLK